MTRQGRIYLIPLEKNFAGGEGHVDVGAFEGGFDGQDGGVVDFDQAFIFGVEPDVDAEVEGRFSERFEFHVGGRVFEEDGDLVEGI